MVEITITIPDGKVSDFKLGFLKIYPNTLGLTDMQHIKKFIKTELLHLYKEGKVLIAQETTPVEIDEGIVED